MTRILIADDHAIVRDGLRRILQSAPGIEVAGEAVSGDEVMTRVRAGGFELLLLDMSMPGKNGIELIKWVKTARPDLAVLVLSMHQEEQYAVRAIRAGASGYVTKESASALLVAAIRKVADGGLYISPGVAEQLCAHAAAAGGQSASSDAVGPRIRGVRIVGGGRHCLRHCRAPAFERQDGKHPQGAHLRKNGHGQRGRPGALRHGA